MKTINHTSNGVPFSRGLRKDILARMEQRYILPTNEPYLYYDINKDIAYVHRPNELRTVCTLRVNNIHGSFQNSHARDRSSITK